MTPRILETPYPPGIVCDALDCLERSRATYTRLSLPAKLYERVRQWYDSIVRLRVG